MYNVTYVQHGASTMVLIFHIHISLISQVSLKFRARAQSSQRFINVFFVNHGLVWLEHFTRIVQTESATDFCFCCSFFASQFTFDFECLNFPHCFFSVHRSLYPQSTFIFNRYLWHTIYMSRFRARSLSQFPLHWIVFISDRIYGINKHRPWERRRSMLWFLKTKSFVQSHALKVKFKIVFSVSVRVRMCVMCVT